MDIAELLPYLLLHAISRNDFNEVNSILNRNVEINKKDDNGNTPLLMAIIVNNIKIVQLIINYANRHNIILDINEKNIYGDYPLLRCILNVNVEMTRLIIEYAEEKKVILEINESNNSGNYPLLWAVIKNNIELIQLIINYADRHDIILIINENDVIEKIENCRNNNAIIPLLGNTKRNSLIGINVDIINLLFQNHNVKRVNIIGENNELLKRNFENLFIDAIVQNNNGNLKIVIDEASNKNRYR